MAPSSIRDAASVVLVRERDGQRQVFWVRRSREVSLGGGFHAFPGGKVDEADAALARSLGLGADGALRVAAMRELFEETGVLVASPQPRREALDQARKALLGSTATFAGVVHSLQIKLDPDRLLTAGRWLTPPFVRPRFDARFFVVVVDKEVAEVWPGELASGEWVTPTQALSRWRSARALLHPPALYILRMLEKCSVFDALPGLNDPPDVVDFVARRIEFQAGLVLVPLRTPTLPPATHTNCLIIGDEDVVVVDPGAEDPAEQAYLDDILAGLHREGRRIREILLTHEHHDHVGGVDALRSKFKVPVRAHAVVADRLRGELHVDGTLGHQEVIGLGGKLGLSLRAVHTPGHTHGHVCFFEETTGSLLAGDTVAGVGSVIVDPDDGDMSQYMETLHGLRALPVGAIYPAHGPVVPDGPAKLGEYVKHRTERENAIWEALSGDDTPEDLVPRVYTDVPEAAWPLAARSVLSVLKKLAKEGRVAATGDRFRRV